MIQELRKECRRPDEQTQQRAIAKYSEINANNPELIQNDEEGKKLFKLDRKAGDKAGKQHGAN